MPFVNSGSGGNKVVPFYAGGQVPNPANVIKVTSAPSTAAVSQPVGTIAINGSTGTAYMCVKNTGLGGTVTWDQLGLSTGTVGSLTGTSGGAVLPTAGNINLLGTAAQIQFVGSGSTLTGSLIGPYAPATYTAHGVLLGQTASSITATAVGSSGQVLTGVTGSDPVWTNLASFNIVDVTATTQAMAVNTKYIADHASALVVFTLPASATIGQTITVIGAGPGGWQINQNASQGIKMLAQVSTVGTGGSLSSTNRYNAVTLQCIVAGSSTIWNAAEVAGSLTVV